LTEAKTTIMKIGGSVITDKNIELTPRTQTIDRLAEETQKANVENLIIVHGGGSFGHPAAQRNAIKEGLRNVDQKIGFAETHHFMTVLNGLVMDSLITHNIPAVTIMTSSCVVTEDGRIRSFEDTPLKMLLKMGFLPVLYGDAVPDAKLGFTVLSGDQLVSALATRLNAQRIIVGVDVDGLFDADPKVEKTAKRFSHLTLDKLRQLQRNVGKSTACDVTGGMFGKIFELLPALEQGIPVTILNAAKPGRIYKALKGESTECTLIEKE
jgi:isopentenyl phosphate kinase